MNSNHKTKDFKLISAKVFLLCLLLAFGSSKAFSQCNYVTTENGKETKLSIPCDFPVKISYDELNVDQINFDKEILKWKNANPTLKSLVLIPSNTKTENISIQISIAEYNKFDFEKKKVIDSNSYFYKVIKENK